MNPYLLFLFQGYHGGSLCKCGGLDMKLRRLQKVLGLFLIFFLCQCTKKNPTSNAKSQTPSGDPTLTEQLAEKAAASAQKTPIEIKQVMFKAIEDLKNSQILEKALKKGDKIPSFELHDVQKGRVQSSELLQKGPLLLIFYRGGWCPYCNLQLRDLQKNLKAIRSTGAQLVAISPEVPDQTAETVKKENLEYFVLSDADGEVGKKFGLMFQLPEDLKGVYLKFGIDLEKSNGNRNWELPLAATYIVNRQGEIIYSFVDADYKKRADTLDLIKILKELGS